MTIRWLIAFGGLLAVGIAVGIQYSTLENVPQLLPEGTPNIELLGVRVRNVGPNRELLAIQATDAQLFLNPASRLLFHAVHGRIDPYALTANQVVYMLESGRLSAHHNVQLSTAVLQVTTDHLQVDPNTQILKLLSNNRVVLTDPTTR